MIVSRDYGNGDLPKQGTTSVYVVAQPSLFSFRGSQECICEWAQVYWWPFKLLIDRVSKFCMRGGYFKNELKSVINKYFDIFLLIIVGLCKLGASAGVVLS